MMRLITLIIILLLSLLPTRAFASFADLSVEEQELITQDAQEAGVPVEQYYAQFVDISPAEDSSNLNEISVGIFTGIGVIAGGAMLLLRYFRKRKVVGTKGDAVLEDEMRKKHLQLLLKTVIIPYFKEHKQFPTEAAFRTAVNSLDVVIKDPRAGLAVPGQEGQQFGYSYSRYWGAKNVRDPQYFKLSCFLSTGQQIGFSADMFKKKTVPKQA